MLLWRFALSLLALFKLIVALRICRNHQLPARSDVAFTFCTDYIASEACLSAVNSGFPAGRYPSELAIAHELDKIRFDGDSEGCADLVLKLLCVAADPWSDSLFDHKNYWIPSICPSTSFSSSLWEQCSQVIMSPNPFSKHGAKGSLASLFRTQREFEKAFQNRDLESNCYSGAPIDVFKPIPMLPRPGSNYSGQTCIQRINFEVAPNQILVGGAPYPTDSDLMAIVDKAGVISLWNMSDDLIKPITFLDIASKVFLSDEAGLLSVVFHPQFQDNGRLFLSMTCLQSSPNDCKKDGDLVVDEYVVPDRCSTPTFSRRILYVDRIFGNAIGGQLLFSPLEDSNLHIFLGDGGQSPDDDVGDPFNNAQNLNTFLGKILRIDVDHPEHEWPYGIPSDNPFVAISGAREEILAFGFRNPWRCAFDRRQPVFLFCGDVGQHRYEEVDRIIAGGNYGWRYYEGRHLYNTSSKLGRPPLVFPEIEYSHSKSGAPAAIIGGYVYRPDHKSMIDGTYFFADELGKLFSAIEVPGSGIYRPTPSSGEWQCATDSPVPCGDDIGLVFSFFETASGDVYIITSKAIFKIVEPDSCKFE